MDKIKIHDTLSVFDCEFDGDKITCIGVEYIENGVITHYATRLSESSNGDKGKILLDSFNIGEYKSFAKDIITAKQIEIDNQYKIHAKKISKELRTRCREEREKYFPDTVKDNLLVGQTYSNALLTIANYSKLVSYYRGLVEHYEPIILESTTKQKIDDVYNSIIFPDEKMIMDIINAEN